MAKSSKPPRSESPTVSAEEGLAWLREEIAKGEALIANDYVSRDDEMAWMASTEEVAAAAFGRNSAMALNVESSGQHGRIIPLEMSERELGSQRAADIRSRLTMLKSTCIPFLERTGRTASSQIPQIAAPIDRVHRILDRFHGVVIQLRRRHANRPALIINDEYDVQDLVRALLRVEFDDIRPEENTPSYAGAAARMDFLLKSERIVVETKMTREKLADKEVGNQLIEDIARYRTHVDCSTLVCFVYDPDHRLSNPSGLERDLSTEHGTLKVVVIVAPRS